MTASSSRINGIPYNGKETAEESLQKVKEEVVNFGVGIEDSQFDRAHRVGNATDKEGKPVKDRQMIVKFTTFWARTLVYRNRKNDRIRLRFYVDQTKRRFELRKGAVEYVKDKPGVDVVFVDINCKLCIRFNNGKYVYFNSKEELTNIVG